MELTGPSTGRAAGGGPGGAATRDVLSLAQRRLGWLDRRQAVLAQNIANADTPSFRPRDVTPFAQALAAAGAPPLARTQAAHLPGGGAARAGTAQDRSVAEAVPDGNAVSLDREAVRMAETDTAHALAMAVHRSFMGMFRTALGRQG
jgi:flagellar basal-body rod protein FlgB